MKFALTTVGCPMCSALLLEKGKHGKINTFRLIRFMRLVPQPRLNSHRHGQTGLDRSIRVCCESSTVDCCTVRWRPR